MMGSPTNQEYYDYLWEERIPEGSFWRELREWGDKYLDAELFRPLFSDVGRPSVYPKYTFLCMLIQLEMNWSDRTLEEESRFDDRVKYALNVPRGFEGIDAVTLCDHRARLFGSDYGNVVLYKTLHDAKEHGFFSSGGQQIIDSFLMEGAAARQDTYTMIRMAVVRTLAIGRFHGLEEELAKVLKRDDYFQEGKPRIDWESETEKERLLASLVHDALRLVETGRTLVKPEMEDLKLALDLLERVATQDVDIDEDGTVKMVQGTAKDRVISVVDPDMRHGRKTTASKTDGYKATIACGGEENRFVTGIGLNGANAADLEAVPEIIEEQARNDAKPDSQLADTGYSKMEKQQEIKKEYGVEIKAKLHPTQNPTGCYTKDAFDIDVEQGTVVCPAGERCEFNNEKTAEHKQTTAVFAASTCNACELKEKCTKSENGRQITIHAYEAELQAEKARQQTEEWKEEYKERCDGERLISHVKRHGGRAARYFERAKNLFQLQLAGALQNIKSLMRLLKKHGQADMGELCPE